MRKNYSFTKHEISQYQADLKRAEERGETLARQLRQLYTTQADFEAAIDALPEPADAWQWNRELADAIRARKAMLDLMADPLAEFLSAPAVESDLDPLADLRYSPC